MSELDNLATFSQLKTLSLTDNPVTRRPNYRAYVIHKLPNLAVLDYRKIKPKEREAAEALFVSESGQQLITAVNAAKQENKKVCCHNVCSN